MKKKNEIADEKIITVQNAEGEPDTKAEIVVQNQIDYAPKVSVIIPVYNVEQYLRQCLDSVVNQTLREIEIICVDDGSTDSSLNILQEYAAKDKRITVIKQENLHAGVARNAGLAVAKGEYLSFLDSDDFFELNMLEEMYVYATIQNSQIVICQYRNYNNDTQEVGDIRGINPRYSIRPSMTFNPADVNEELFTICNPMPWNKLFSREFIVNENIHYQNLPACNDVYFSLTAMACAQRISILNKSFIYYRYNLQSSLKNTRDKNPFNFYQAYKGIYSYLLHKSLFNKYKKTFLTSLMSSAFWTIKHTRLAKQDVKKFIRDTIIPEFQILNNKQFLPKGCQSQIERLYNPDIIISLTSHPARIDTVSQTIETLLEQSVVADRIILWLAEEQFPNKEADLPASLLALREKGLTIDWCHDIKSYKKLIPALKKYPDAIIVTADDDLLYDKDWLKYLYQSYTKNPQYIHCHRITRLYNRDNKFVIMSRNLYLDSNKKYMPELCLPSAYNKLSGGAGALFPPHCFTEEVFNEDKFMSLAPTSDDIWFWLMSLINGYRVKVVDNNIYELKYVPNTQDVGLCKINDGCRNKIFYQHLNNLYKAYEQQLQPYFVQDNESNKKLCEKMFENMRNNLADKLVRWYKNVHKKPLNLDNPRTFNEKIQWLKLYDSTPLKTRLADKYLVREWVKEKIGEEYLIPLLGVYDRFEDIDFDKLPNQFVIKCNHGSGYNIIVKDKSSLDLAEAKQKIDMWMQDNFAFHSMELHYRDIQPKIVIEKYMDEIGDALYDYRFFCFNGKVKQIWLDIFSGTPNHKRKIYDTNWNELNITVKWPRLETDVEKPHNLEKMIRLAEKMSEGFALVRVDFYDVNDKIYFGEMTFTSMSGTGKFEPEIEDLKLGKLITLPKLAYNIDTGEYYKLPKNYHKKLLKKTQPQSLISYKLFNFIPLFTYKKRAGRKTYKILGLPVWKIRKMANNITTKCYFCGIPLLKINDK